MKTIYSLEPRIGTFAIRNSGAFFVFAILSPLTARTSNSKGLYALACVRAVPCLI